MQVIRGDEAAGWRQLVAMKTDNHGPALSQVQFISPLLTGEKLTLKSLRDAAALVHAPLLLVYVETDSHEEGYNEAAMAYWSIVGLFTVPGNTVGHYTVCQAVLVDTRSGFILATTEGESVREENVLPGAVDIARPRTERESKAEAVAKLQAAFRETLLHLAQSRGKWITQPATGPTSR